MLMGLDVCVPSNDKCLLLGFLRDGLREGRLSRRAYDKIMGEKIL
jgi:hypothetical protein